MCGRYPEPWDYKDIEKYFAALEDHLGFLLRARYNIACAESLNEKPAYHRPYLTQRCLVPAGAVSSAMASTSTKFAGGISAKDASVLAREMHCEPEFLTATR